ncbi:peptide-methionine (R)-S-oxide reductase MsrB [Kangiella geojedonensis]|uniref:2-dehydropantoate 2-reductase n=1 Tax=Kangiella geojedonensis TaxID=914150 RepID=A0A0F6RBE2_9GAMM|nr:peptide-methionine (R)-S-oxide reductase MsrB [Kangiella geojedonensis]AKE51478.1 2-dehydropantoate 2-reductase [Kangiella geojedonensis]
MITILGAGAIGQLLAHKLTEASIDCQLIVKADAQYSSEWCLTHQEHQIYHEIPAVAAQDCDELWQVWVCVKSHQLEAALDSISHAITDSTNVVLFQNGMGHEKIALRYIQPQQLYFASNTHGAYIKAKQAVHYAGQGKITFGHLESDSKPEFLTQQICDALNAEWHPSINNILWQKLSINAVVNPLTSIYQCKNGELLDSDKWPKVLALINENQRLADTLAINLDAPLKETIITVIEATANNQSSMLQDVLKGNLTEINSINGYLLDQASKYDIPVPHNWRLWSEFHIAYPPLKQLAQANINNLDPATFHVTQQQGTEPPFSGSYNLHHEQGTYHCVCCESPLFKDDSKFDSGCGWPSFDRAQDNKAIAYRADDSHGMSRTEILCAQCGSHLGHIFDDGPTETGQRFCVNSVSLQFEQEKS